jgi:hypothetical protein
MALQGQRLTEGSEGPEGGQTCLKSVTKTADTLHQNPVQLKIVKAKAFARNSVPAAPFTSYFYLNLRTTLINQRTKAASGMSSF